MQNTIREISAIACLELDADDGGAREKFVQNLSYLQNVNNMVVFQIGTYNTRYFIPRGKSLLELWVTTFLPDWTATLKLCPIYLKTVHVL